MILQATQPDKATRLLPTSAVSKAISLVAIVCMGAVLFWLVSCVRGNTIVTGRIISDNTGRPIEGAMVYIHSELPGEDNGTNNYLSTDGAGRFDANIRGNVSLIKAWKPGYAIRGIQVDSDVKTAELVVKLRELTKTNLVVEHIDFYNLSNGSGFSFASGRSVAPDSPLGDLLIMPAPNDRTSAYIQARGEAGILFQSSDDETDFYNSPLAPSSGYMSRLKIDSNEGFYFIRTSDGKHYAKFRLLVDLAEPSNGRPYLDLERCQIIWAYQPDGSRNLEVRPSKNLPFPVEKFGLDRESFGRVDGSAGSE